MGVSDMCLKFFVCVFFVFVCVFNEENSVELTGCVSPAVLVKQAFFDHVSPSCKCRFSALYQLILHLLQLKMFLIVMFYQNEHTIYEQYHQEWL